MSIKVSKPNEDQEGWGEEMKKQNKEIKYKKRTSEQKSETKKAERAKTMKRHRLTNNK